MITVEEAQQLIANETRDFGIEEIPLEKAVGRILRESITADRDFPPFDRVTMDGIAICFEDYQNGNTSFKIRGIAAAGAKKMSLHSKNECLEVMTGAVMPEGLDTVIPYEHIEIQNQTANLKTEDIRFQQNIHFKGQDRKQGDLLLHSGTKISSPEIGVCATIGKSTIKASRLPKAIVLSSGDELIDIDQTPEAHQIRKSNVYHLKTLLSHYQLSITTEHLMDDYDTIVKKLSVYLEKYDLIVLSGGVSKGKFDYLPKALESLGVHKHFHRVAQRPGKPFWFGSKNNTTVFAFPGNPISSFMCMHVYLKPWLNQSMQATPQALPCAVLGEEVQFKPDLTYFLEVKLHYSEKGQLIGTPAKGNGSGDLANLVDADAFIQLPRGKRLFQKGEVYPIILYR